VAVDAGGCVAIPSLNGLAVEAAVVGRLLVGVTGRAADFQRRGFVRGTLHVGVAVDACEHAAVDGIFEVLGIDMQADRLAIDVVGQRGIAVTGKALFRSGLWRLLGGWRLAGREERSCEEQ